MLLYWCPVNLIALNKSLGGFHFFTKGGENMDKPQTQLLKRIKRAGLFDYSVLDATDINLLHFLKSNKYIVPVASNNSNKRPFYKITELGKSELYKISQKTFRYWLPIIVSNLFSLGSLVISIIAILK